MSDMDIQLFMIWTFDYGFIGSDAENQITEVLNEFFRLFNYVLQVIIEPFNCLFDMFHLIRLDLSG